MILGQQDLCRWHSRRSLLSSLVGRRAVFGGVGVLSCADLILCAHRVEACSDPGSHRLC